jgi:glycerate 2-kinase
MMTDHRKLLRDMFDAAAAAALPDCCVPKHLPPPPKGRAVVVGAGKAAGSMAAAVEAHWDVPVEGVVVTRYGHKAPCKKIEVIEASHPVPDAAGRDAARRILEKVQGLGPDDLVLCLISGGGSALLALPAPGLTLDDKQAINRALLKSGATITEMNCVRKHLSAIKGGTLAAAAAPAKVVSLIISDVPGDDISVIASGPTAPDASTSAEALAILDKYKIAVPQSVLNHLSSKQSETPKPGDPRLAEVQNILIATPQASLEAAARVAQNAGFRPLILSDAIEKQPSPCAETDAAVAMPNFF